MTQRAELAWLRKQQGRLARHLEIIERRLVELGEPVGGRSPRPAPEREAAWEQFELADRETAMLVEDLSRASPLRFLAFRQLHRAKRSAEERLYRALQDLEATR